MRKARKKGEGESNVKKAGGRESKVKKNRRRKKQGVNQ